MCICILLDTNINITCTKGGQRFGLCCVLCSISHNYWGKFQRSWLWRSFGGVDRVPNWRFNCHGTILVLKFFLLHLHAYGQNIHSQFQSIGLCNTQLHVSVHETSNIDGLSYLNGDITLDTCIFKALLFHFIVWSLKSIQTIYIYMYKRG